MPLQYLKDNYNNTTAVEIPIKDWDKITQIHQDTKVMLEPETSSLKKLKASDYRGAISKESAKN